MSEQERDDPGSAAELFAKGAIRWTDPDGYVQVTYPAGVTAAEALVDVLDAERLAAVLEGRNDPGYNPPDFPLLQGYDDTERGRDH